MHNFVIIRLEEIKGAIPFFKLSIDNKCQIDEFEIHIKKHTTYLPESRILRTYMDLYSTTNGRLPPKNKFKFIKTNSANKLFEFKSKHLRYYGFSYRSAMILCAAELNDKSEQKLDIKRIENIQKQYLENLNKLENGKKRIIGK